MVEQSQDEELATLTARVAQVEDERDKYLGLIHELWDVVYTQNALISADLEGRVMVVRHETAWKEDHDATDH